MIDRETLFRSAVASQPAFVFESNPAMAEACAAMIRELRLRVDVTGDSGEALRLAKEREYCFALIRLTAEGATGEMEVASAVRARCATTHIVLISTSWPLELLNRTKDLSRTVTLEVPSDTKKFRELIRRTVTTWSAKARTGVAEGPDAPAAPSQEPDAPKKPAASRALNRRNHVRFGVDGARVELHEKRWVPLPFGAGNKGRRLVDLSKGGACLVSTVPLKPGAKVRLRVHLEKYDDQIELSAEVRWCRPNRGEFLAGTAFVDLDPEQARKLKIIEGLFTSAGYAAMGSTKKRTKP